MSVTKVTEDWKGYSAGVKGSLEGNTGQGQRKFVVEFDNTDTPSNRPILALTADDGSLAIPALWDTHPVYTDWFVKGINASTRNSPVLFDVVVDYEYIEDPLSRSPQIQWTFASSNEPFDKDKDDKPIVNSADEPFDPPLSKDVHDQLIRVVRNEATFDPAVAADFKGAVNSDVLWNGSFGGCYKCTVFDAVEKRAGALTYYEVTYEFQFRPDGWSRRVLDQGFREKIGKDKDDKPVYASITDKEGNPVTQPAALDGLGKKLKSGADAVFLSFELDKTREFESLNITF